jgi:predicted permease
MVAPIAPQEFLLGYDYLDWRDTRGPFEIFGSWSGAGQCDLGERDAIRVPCARADASFLPTLGTRLEAGRNFTASEDAPNGPASAIISYRLWQSRFGGDQHVIGKSALVDGRVSTILGVLPGDFELPSGGAVDVLLTQALDPAEQRTRRTAVLLGCVARLRPNVDVAQAYAALQPAFNASMQFVPAQFRKDVSLRVRTLRERQVGSEKQTSWLLLGAVFSVLLIACANAANLLLARGASRQQELALQVALGAGRARLIRQGFAESLLLSLAGSGAGCALGFFLLQSFASMAPEGIPHLNKASLDPRVLGFSLAAAIVSGILFGIAPAISSARVDALAGSRQVGPRSHLFRHALVTVQIGVSVVLLSAAGLLLRSLWNLQHQSLGMRTEGVTAASFTLGRTAYSDATRRAAFFDQLEARISAIPGIGQIALTDSLPPSGNSSGPMLYGAIDVQGKPQHTAGTGGTVVWRSVTPAYFQILGIPILQGRGFQESDRDSGRNSVIISRVLARRMFPGEDPVGRQIRPGRTGPWLTVVGVAADVKNSGLVESAGPEYYYVRKPGAPNLSRTASVIVRSTAPPATVAARVRSEIAELDSALPVKTETLPERVDYMARRPRFNTLLLGIFASIGVLLAALGLYGVISFLVVQRTREIGVRMALGATPASILQHVMYQAFAPTLLGAVLGLAGALASARLVASLLFRVSPADPWMLALPSIVFFAIAALAVSIPARRAAHIDPMQALRQE